MHKTFILYEFATIFNVLFSKYQHYQSHIPKYFNSLINHQIKTVPITINFITRFCG